MIGLIKKWLGYKEQPDYFCGYCLKNVASVSPKNTGGIIYFHHAFCPNCKNILTDDVLLKEQV